MGIPCGQVSLKYAFQTPDDLYLILDMMTGGAVMIVLCSIRFFAIALWSLLSW